MPKRKQIKINSPLKEDINLYREIQKEKSQSRPNTPTSSTSSNLTGLIGLSEEKLEELELTSIHKKAKEKTKHLEPATKKQKFNDEEINLNLVTPEYLDISQQEFLDILNTPEKIFTLAKDEVLGSEKWNVEEDLINMTDEEFEKIIENPDSLEDTLNSLLDENEKAEKEIKETIFAFLLETEKELGNILKEDTVNEEEPSTSNVNIDSEDNLDKSLNQEELLEKGRKQLIKKRNNLQRERELLKKLEEDLERLKEMQGEKEFPSILYDKIENEILLKTKKIKIMKKKYITNRRYAESKKGKETRKIYGQSENAKESNRKYKQSEKCKETQKIYNQSEKRKESKRRYNHSEKGKVVQQRKNEIRRQKRLEEKLRAEIDPEFRKILEEKRNIINEKQKIRREKKKLEKLLSINNQNI